MSSIKGKRIIITGGAGSVGSELVRQLCQKNKIFILDISERAFVLSQELKQKGHWVEARIGDIRDENTVQDLFEDFKPQYVFHAAALKHVSPHESYPKEAIMTNAIGTYNVLHHAKRYECLEKFIYISTDKVVNANSIMGITKKVGEIMVRNQGGICVRFGNVMGSDGSVIPIWQRQVDDNLPFTVTDKNAYRYLMTIPESIKLVIEATEQGKGGEIFIMDMGKQVNILEIVTKLSSELKREVPIKMIGLRPGETLGESLMTEEESKKAVKKGKFYVIGSNSVEQRKD